MTSEINSTSLTPILEIHHPDKSRSFFELGERTRTTVGRYTGADLKLTETLNISRIQLEIVCEEPYYYLLNRSTTVETLLNGRPVPPLEKHPEPLHHNDQISFGLYKIIFHDQNDTRLNRPVPSVAQPDRPAAPVNPKAGAGSPQPGVAARRAGFELKEDGTVSYRGIQDHLSPRLYNFLVCLYNRYPETCRTEELEEQLSEAGYSPEIHRLTTDLRNFFKQTWGEEGEAQPKIENLRKFGYRLSLD